MKFGWCNDGHHARSDGVREKGLCIGSYTRIRSLLGASDTSALVECSCVCHTVLRPS